MQNVNAMRIENINHTHVPQIAQLETLCFSHPWSYNALLEHIQSTTNHSLCIIDMHKVLGYITCSVVLDEAFIANIAVHPDFRHMNIASSLISRLKLDLSFASFITLEVRKSNFAAIKLYIKNSFTEVGIRKKYYQNPEEDAVLMTYFYKKMEI